MRLDNATTIVWRYAIVLAVLASLIGNANAQTIQKQSKSPQNSEIEIATIKYFDRQIDSHESSEFPREVLNSSYKALTAMKLSQEGNYDIFPYLYLAFVQKNDDGKPYILVKWLHKEFNLPKIALYDVSGNRVGEWKLARLPWADDSAKQRHNNLIRYVVVWLKEPDAINDGAEHAADETNLTPPGDLSINLDIEIAQLAGLIMFGDHDDERPQYQPLVFTWELAEEAPATSDNDESDVQYPPKIGPPPTRD